MKKNLKVSLVAISTLVLFLSINIIDVNTTQANYAPPTKICWWDTSLPGYTCFCDSKIGYACGGQVCQDLVYRCTDAN
jgi:hypothetical protein